MTKEQKEKYDKQRKEEHEAWSKKEDESWAERCKERDEGKSSEEIAKERSVDAKRLERLYSPTTMDAETPCNLETGEISAPQYSTRSDPEYKEKADQGPFVLRMAVQLHEEYHYRDPSLKQPCKDLVKARNDLDAAAKAVGEEKGSNGKKKSEDQQEREQAAHRAALEKYKNAQKAWDEAIKKSECGAYKETLWFLRKRGKCYKWLKEWIKFVKDKINRNCP